MQFHTYLFLAVFLPLVLLGAWVARRMFGATAYRGWLLLSSVAFIACAEVRILPIVGLLLAVNYLVACYLQGSSRPLRRTVLLLGAAGNVGLLVACRLIGTPYLSAVGVHWSTPASLLLPLGIAFLVLRQITFLQSVYLGERSAGTPLGFGLYSLFFPELLAGPVSQPAELMPQLERPDRNLLLAGRLFAALAIFTVGLVKKVLIADQLAPLVSEVFGVCDQGRTVPPVEAWLGVLAFGLQLYFDCSGYSDMAMGVARLFGVRLPTNFANPYQASSIIEFWRRWQITIGRFFRDAVYLPLGGSAGPWWRQALLLTGIMLLVAIWHALTWTMLFWGGLQGLALSINHGWRRLRGQPATSAGWVKELPWRVLTLLFVLVAWVPFRCATLAGAGRLTASLVGWTGTAVTPAISATDWTVQQGFLVVAALWACCLFFPDTQQMLARFRPALERNSVRWTGPRWTAWLQIRPHWVAATALAILFLLAFGQLGGVQPFYYLQF